MSHYAYSVAAVSWTPGSHLRIYTSDGSKVTEKCWDGSWYVGALAVDGQKVGATSWVDSTGQIHIRVYVSNLGKITEQCWDKDHWYVGALAADGESASATSWQEGGSLRIRVYVTQYSGQVQEHCWDGAGPWYIGAYPGA